MRSKITIELDFDLNVPYIRVDNVTTDDVRDKILQNFREKLGASSSWMRVEFEHSPSDSTTFRIYAVTPKELEEQAEIMRKQAEFNKLN